MAERADLIIGGARRPASDGATFEVNDPADGTVLATVASASVADGLEAVAEARAAAPDWRARPPRERGEILRAAFELMAERRREIAETIVRENGKPLVDALGEVDYAAEFFRWYAEEAVRNLGSIGLAPSGSNEMLVTHEPVGVCVLVTPWNFPAAMATRKIGPALAAGCTTVLKPASDTPLTALLLAELLAEAGVPPGVVNVIPSRRSAEVVEAMLADPSVRKLSFTGSTEVGRDLLQSAARTVVNTSMELGGNAPFLILADADLSAAVEGALVAKMRNIGEACTAANRFYVERPVVAEFTERLAAAMAEMPIGHGLEPLTRVGPLINDAACEKIDALLRDARDRGAKLVTGGSRIEGPGSFFRPTVIADVPRESGILREEIFGPVAPVVAFDDVADAVAQANDTPYGLVAYLYTQDLRRGLDLCGQLEAGMIALNRGLVSDPAAPFGGIKESGIGREGGHEGLLDYTESKYVALV